MVPGPVDPVTGLMVAEVGAVLAAGPPRVDVEPDDVVVRLGVLVEVVRPVEVVVSGIPVVEVACGAVTVVCTGTWT